ncbi:DUF748 domain-containing protein [Marinagarivorans algicola]|uniref:DUF748 domain-containing protein n=1 Tax=Marinagarivorans algicola TaxID=1513270 RepID=UPI0006B4A7A9|nr:DUF748 domain-containing protein [Marinagarivorans algicola]
MRLIKWLFGLAITLAVLLALMPLAGKYYALHWFEAHNYDAKIKSFNMNPLTGKLTVAGLDVRVNDEQGLRIDMLEATFKIPELFKKEAIVRKLRTQGVQLSLGKLDPELDRFVNPIERFVNRHMPAWRFAVVNSLNENAKICRTGATTEGKVVSQCVSIGSFSVTDTSLQNTRKGWQLSTRSTASFQRIYFKDHFEDTALIYIGQLEVRDVIADNHERRIGQLALKSFYLVERSEQETQRLDIPYQTQIENMLINNIVATRAKKQLRINVELIDMTALRQTVHRNHEAGFVMVQRLRDIFPMLNSVWHSEASVPEQVPPEVVVSVLKTRVLDGSLAWLDDSVSPPAKESMTALSFELGPVMSDEPDLRAPVTLDATLGETGRIAVNGHIAPFAERANFDLAGSIKGLNMHKVAGYAESLFAEKIQQGILDTRFTMSAQSAHMQGDAAIRFTNLQTHGGTNRAGLLSLHNAFNQLKGHNNAVDFDAYFDIDMTHSESLVEALGRDIKRALSNKANGYVDKPRKTSSKAKTGMSFEPLKYNPKTHELRGAQAIRFKDILVLAKQSPQKTLTLCPITTGGEWAALYRQGKKLKSGEQIPSVEYDHLMNMSILRAKVLRDVLTEAGIARERYSLCEPRVDPSHSGPSFVSAQLR